MLFSLGAPVKIKEVKKQNSKKWWASLTEKLTIVNH